MKVPDIGNVLGGSREDSTGASCTETLDQQPDEDAWGITQAVNAKQEWHTRGVSTREID